MVDSFRRVGGWGRLLVSPPKLRKRYAVLSILPFAIGRFRLLMYRKIFHRTKTSTSNRYRDTTRRYTLLVVSSNSTLIENEKAR